MANMLFSKQVNIRQKDMHPGVIDEMIEHGYFAKGNAVYVHSYKEITPDVKIDSSASPPFLFALLPKNPTYHRCGAIVSVFLTVVLLLSSAAFSNESQFCFCAYDMILKAFDDPGTLSLWRQKQVVAIDSCESIQMNKTAHVSDSTVLRKWASKDDSCVVYSQENVENENRVLSHIGVSFSKHDKQVQLMMSDINAKFGGKNDLKAKDGNSYLMMNHSSCFLVVFNHVSSIFIDFTCE